MVKLLIVGCGIIAHKSHLPALRALADLFEIIACCNRTLPKAQAFASSAGIAPNAVYSDIAQALRHPGVEAVALLLPPTETYGALKLALAAHKHVLLEKPIAPTVADAKSLIALARSTDCVIAVGENWAHHSGIRRARSLVRSGAIGDIVSFSASVVRAFNPHSAYAATAWRVHPKHVGGYLSDGGVHDWARILSLLPDASRPRRVTAFARQVYKEHGAEDTIAAAVRLEGGAVGSYHMTMCAAQTNVVPASAVVVVGTRGSASVVGDNVTVDGEGGGTWRVYEEETQRGFVDEWRDFHAAITEHTRPLVGLDDALVHLEVVSACVESARSDGKPIDM